MKKKKKDDQVTVAAIHLSNCDDGTWLRPMSGWADGRENPCFHPDRTYRTYHCDGLPFLCCENGERHLLHAHADPQGWVLGFCVWPQ